MSVTFTDQDRNTQTLAIPQRAEVTTGTVQLGDLLAKDIGGGFGWIPASTPDIGQPVSNAPSWYATVR